MPCHHVKINGMSAIIRTPRQPRRKCHVCRQRWATKLCDFPKRKKTCDARLCDQCAVSVGPDQDFCPSHDRVQPALPGLTVDQ